MPKGPWDAGGPKDRIWLDGVAVEEQCRALGEAWKGIVPNLRRKHIGAALRAVMRDNVLPKYRQEAADREKGKGYRKKYKPTQRVSKKTGKITDSRRRVVGNLRRSVGSTRIYPGYPRESAVDMKGGYRMGKKGGSAAMLIDEGTRARFRKGSYTRIKAFASNARLSYDLVRGNRRYFKKSARRINSKNAYLYRSGLNTSAKARKGYTGYLKAERIQDRIFGSLKGMTIKEMKGRLWKAYNKAYKEQTSVKYKSIMNRYMQKWGKAGFSNPSAGWFGKRLPPR